jgi:periplasmic divalent cation tolerance protein
MVGIVLVTFPDKRSAEKVRSALLEKRLVACANLTHVDSKYWWKGKVERASEYLMLAKTKEELYDKVEEEVKNLHPYEVPEILFIKVDRGLDEYLKWVKEETR